MEAVSDKIKSLLAELTLEEKVDLLAGASFWYTTPVERLGIPAIKVTDGPNGARGGGLFGSGVSAACFPAGISLGSTWNTELVGQVGAALAEEAKTKGAVVLLGPTVNIHRSTLNGRNFECYSEDPYLAGRLAVAYIEGLQKHGIGASVKHFAGNNSEFERNTISSEIGERALREIYLPAFEAAVKDADSWTVMAAYNKVNGTFASEHPELLTSILKREWGFRGVVVSDWFATHSVGPAANAGLDLEMPGPTGWRGKRLVDAVNSGEVPESVIDEAAARMLFLIERSGSFEHPEIPEEQAVNRPEHRAVARQAAAEGVVLLKNSDGILPLDPEKIKSIAIIGPNAKTAQIMGGGSAQVKAHYSVTPFDGITAQLCDGVEVGYEIGATNHKFTPHLPLSLVTATAGRQEGMLTVTYYNSADLSGAPVLVDTLSTAEPVWLGYVGPGVDPSAFSARLSGTFTPQESGRYLFGLTSSGLSRLFVDGKELINNWDSQSPGDSFMGGGSAEKLAEIELTAGQPVEVVAEYSKAGGGVIAGIRIGAMPVPADDAIERAAALAAKSDVAIVFVGSSGEWESEGADRPDMELYGRQVELIEAVAAANSCTVVVLQTGSPIVMPWLDAPAAVLQAWFPGQECGNGIADVLLGRVDASGRLPQTFPIRLQDNPAYINYPGDNGKVFYGEGIFVGYRYYDKKEVAPLFPFGYGLSYTTFDYSNLRLNKDTLSAGDTLEVSVDVTNSGDRDGKDVAQVYVRDTKASVARPEKELKGFAKVALAAGETKTVTVTLDRRSLAYWDDREHSWMAEAGEFQVLVGRSAAELLLSESFHLTDSSSFDGPGRTQQRLTLDSSIKEILANPTARAIVDRHVPGFSANPQLGFASGFSLAQLSGFDAQTFNQKVLRAIAADLAAE